MMTVEYMYEARRELEETLSQVRDAKDRMELVQMWVTGQPKDPRDGSNGFHAGPRHAMGWRLPQRETKEILAGFRQDVGTCRASPEDMEAISRALANIEDVYRRIELHLSKYIEEMRTAKVP